MLRRIPSQARLLPAPHDLSRGALCFAPACAGERAVRCRRKEARADTSLRCKFIALRACILSQSLIDDTQAACSMLRCASRVLPCRVRREMQAAARQQRGRGRDRRPGHTRGGEISTSAFTNNVLRCMKVWFESEAILIANCICTQSLATRGRKSLSCTFCFDRHLFSCAAQQMVPLSRRSTKTSMATLACCVVVACTHNAALLAAKMSARP